MQACIPMKSSLLLRLAALLFALALFPPVTHSHVSGFTDTSIQIAEPGVLVLYTTPLDNLLELATDTPTALSDIDPEAYYGAITRGFRITVDGQTCEPARQNARILTSLESAQYRMEWRCPSMTGQFHFAYRLFLQQDPSHRNLTRLFVAGKRLTFNFTQNRPVMDVPVADLLTQWGRGLAPQFSREDPNKTLPPTVSQSGTPLDESFESHAMRDDSQGFFASLNPAYFQLGLEHILGGIDHVLFIAALVLLPATLSKLAALVTSFTVAHSITLSLSVLDVVTLPVSLTEPAIALSIVFVCLMTLYAVAGVRHSTDWVKTLKEANRHRLMITFAFGLIHGFGFSYILREMGLGEERVGALLLFNLGVEAGQLLLIVALFPVLLLVQRLSKGWVLVSANALVVLVISSYWFFERVGSSL